MPHIIVKMYPGRTEEVKRELVRKITQDVVETAGCEERVVSVAIEEISREDWAHKVYLPDIMDCPETIYKQPGYNPFQPDQVQSDQVPSDQVQSKDGLADTDPNAEQTNPGTASLAAYVSDAVKSAKKEDTTGLFNPMSWMDLELEDRPESFDPFFDTPWHQLSEEEQSKRMGDVRSVL